MAKLSFNNNNNQYQSGKATISKAELEENKVTLWFELAAGKVVRENYRLNKTEEVKKLKAAVRAILGDVPQEFDTNDLVGKCCDVELEERPWKEGRTWTGVAEVKPWIKLGKHEVVKSVLKKSKEERLAEAFGDDDFGTA